MVTKVTKYGVFGHIFMRNPPLFFEIGGTFRMDSPYLSPRLLGGIYPIGGTYFPTQNLLSHAEVFKDVVEDFVGGNLTASNFGKSIEGEAEVFSKKVAA